MMRCMTYVAAAHSEVHPLIHSLSITACPLDQACHTSGPAKPQGLVWRWDEFAKCKKIEPAIPNSSTRVHTVLVRVADICTYLS